VTFCCKSAWSADNRQVSGALSCVRNHVIIRFRDVTMITWLFTNYILYAT
jgi:hypothetical protein